MIWNPNPPMLTSGYVPQNPNFVPVETRVIFPMNENDARVGLESK